MSYVAVLASATLIGLRQGADALDPPCPSGALCALELPRQVAIEGWITTEPGASSATKRFDFEVAALKEEDLWVPQAGRIRIWTRGLGEQWHEGSCMRARVWLRRPRNFKNPGAFDYVHHLLRNGITVTGTIWNQDSIERCYHHRGRLREIITAARRRIAAAIDAAVAPGPAGIIRALVIGDCSGLSRSLRATYARAGVAHILSISGLHLAVVAGAAFSVLRVVAARSEAVLARGLAPRLAAAGALPVSIAYAVLAGASAPTLRSAVMIAAHLTAVMCCRRGDLIRSLALAALAIAIGWPGAAFDPSFALSFAAVASIALGLRRFHAYWADRWMDAAPPRVAVTTAGAKDIKGLRPGSSEGLARRLARWALACMVTSVCAALGTEPLSAFHFNVVSFAGPLANLVAVPVFSAAVVAALCGAAVSLCGPLWAVVPFWIAGAFVRAGDAFVVAVASLPGAATRVVTPTLLELCIAYAGLGCLVFCRGRKRRLVLLAGVALVAAGDGLYWIRERYARPALRVTFLDVGQGDAAVVEFPGSAVLLVDGGGFPGSDFDTGEAIIAPFLWSRKIGRVDYVAMSHAEIDHAGGLPFLIREFRPREFWWNGRPGRGEAFDRLQAALKDGKVATRRLSRDTPPWTVGRVTIEVLHPPAGLVQSLPSNDSSLVLRLAWGLTTVLFTGDIEGAGEQHILQLGAPALRTGVLKIPHHGSLTSNGEPFLDAVQPDVAVVSAGANNRHAFPQSEVCARYQARGICLWRTDKHGAVMLSGTATGYRVDPPCAECPASGGSRGPC